MENVEAAILFTTEIKVQVTILCTTDIMVKVTMLFTTEDSESVIFYSI